MARVPPARLRERVAGVVQERRAPRQSPRLPRQGPRARRVAGDGPLAGHGQTCEADTAARPRHHRLAACTWRRATRTRRRPSVGGKRPAEVRLPTPPARGERGCLVLRRNLRFRWCAPTLARRGRCRAIITARDWCVMPASPARPRLGCGRGKKGRPILPCSGRREIKPRMCRSNLNQYSVYATVWVCWSARLSPSYSRV